MRKDDKSRPGFFGIRPLYAYLFLFLLAFGIRLVYLSQFESTPTFHRPILDEADYLELAQLIGSPQGLPDEPYYRTPLYPYLLSFVYRITGESIFTTRLVQILLGSVLPLLIMALGVRLFNKPVGFAGGIIAALYPTFIYYDGSLLTTSTMVLLTTLLIWQLYRCQERMHWKSFVFAGLLLGLAALARPNILLLAPALLIWIWLVIKPALGFKRAMISYLVIGLACMAIIIPVTIRNYAVSHDFVLISWQGGFNFWLGNHRQANGWSAVAPGMDASLKGAAKQSITIAEAKAKKPLLRSEVSRYWYASGWNHIRSDLSGFVARTLKKLRLLVNGFEIPNVQNIYHARTYGSILRPLLFTKGIYFPYGILTPLALVGIALSIPRWRKYLILHLFLASYAISVIAFFVCARFRQPLIPVLILFAAYAVHQLVGYLRNRRFLPVLVILLAVAALMFETNHQLLEITPKELDAWSHYSLGNAYKDQGNLTQARAEYELAYQADTSNVYALINIGCTYRDQNNFPEAIKRFREAINKNPSIHNSFLYLGNLYMVRGEFEEAAAVLANGCRMARYNDEIHLELARAYYGLNRFEDAKAALEICLRLNRDNRAARRLYMEVVQKLQDKN